MNILHLTTTTEQHGKDGGLSLGKRIGIITAKLGEAFWFCLSFLLFIIMGPFSAFAVLIGLWSLASSKECRDHMTEPAKI